MPRSPPPRFATFWHGPLDPITYTCMASFPALDLDLKVYAYADLELPPGVERADARQIVADETLTGRFLFENRPSLAKFSNLFRYLMIRDTQSCWVDGDILCLRRPQFGAGEAVLGWQEEPDHDHAINVAVLMLPDGPVLQGLIAGAAAAVDRSEPWGATGPAMLTRLARGDGLDALAAPRSAFYPVRWHEFHMPLLPAFRGAVEAATADSTLLHLWNERIRRSGFDRSACAPAGSFFHEACRRLGALDRFDRIYGEAEAARILGQSPAPAKTVPT